MGGLCYWAIRSDEDAVVLTVLIPPEVPKPPDKYRWLKDHVVEIAILASIWTLHFVR